MKFQKTLVAVAIAGIASVPMIASADTTLSGVVEINMNGSDLDVAGSAAVADDPATPNVDETAAAVEAADGEIRVGTGDVLFGIVSEQELNSGLTGYGSVRLDLDSLSNSKTKSQVLNETGDVIGAGEGSAFPTGDNVYVGIKGGFGDVRLGEIPLAVEYGQVANDIFDVGDEISGGLSYTGTFGPVGLVANFSPERNQDAIGIGAKFGIGGFSIGVGAEDRAELQNMSVGASYAIGGASLAAHFWTKETGGDDDESVSVKLGYGFGGVTAALTVSTLEGASGDKDAVRVDLGYDLGGGLNLSTRVTAKGDADESDNDLTEYRIQLAKSF